MVGVGRSSGVLWLSLVLPFGSHLPFLTPPATLTLVSPSFPSTLEVESRKGHSIAGSPLGFELALGGLTGVLPVTGGTARGRAAGASRADATFPLVVVEI